MSVKYPSVFSIYYAHQKRTVIRDLRVDVTMVIMSISVEGFYTRISVAHTEGNIFFFRSYKTKNEQAVVIKVFFNNFRIKSSSLMMKM
jgi:hypothetical protein